MTTSVDITEPVATLLLVDDDETIRTLLAENLVKRGYLVHTAANTTEMDGVLARHPVDAIILDVMLPGEDGLAAARRIVAEGGPPIVMLSALGEEEDRVLGLEFGADHYLTKPCSPREVIAHVRAVLRRHHVIEPPRNILHFRGWRIDLDSHELLDPQGVLVELTDGEFAMLRALVERPRRVLKRDELLQAARGPHTESFDRAVDIQISRLRRKLKAPGDSLIRTVWNEGYMLVAKVAAASSPR
ncbi:MAG: response regulator [Gammaproteobacteria bacterium]